MLLLVGLGNPGREHARQRHNIGFMAVDAIARRTGAPPFRTKFRSQLSELAFGGERVVLLKPDTFMNLSGAAVREAAAFFKLDLPAITIIHDELDLEPGKVRVKTGGGNAGHNGLRSITAELGNDYRRVRIGIGHPGMKERVLGWVLGDFGKSETWVDPVCDGLADCLGDLVARRDAEIQNKLHQVWLQAQN